ncbi:MAG: hypothetical protein GX021_00940 [Tissierellia bacterium]|nr:hypothetical protein [Tissierellia bacterium]
MRKFMKYEIKGSYKFVLGIIAVLLVASTIIQYNIYREINIGSPSGGDVVFRSLTVLVSILVIFGAFLAAFLHIVSLFRKELYENRGYLTFTLPLTGNKILGAKILVGAIWYAAIALSIVLYNFFLGSILHGSGWIGVVKRVISYIGPSTVLSVITSSIIESVQSIFLALVLIYLSIALSKVSIKNKRIGGLWFVIFLVLSGFLSFLTSRISAAFPYYLSLENFKILHYYDIVPYGTIFGNITQMSNIFGYINIVGSLVQIAFIVLGFLATSYLIENKIDL